MVVLAIVVNSLLGSSSREIIIPVSASRLITGAFPNGFTVPTGETWEFQGQVNTRNSIIVHGSLE